MNFLCMMSSPYRNYSQMVKFKISSKGSQYFRFTACISKKLKQCIWKGNKSQKRKSLERNVHHPLLVVMLKFLLLPSLLLCLVEREFFYCQLIQLLLLKSIASFCSSFLCASCKLFYFGNFLVLYCHKKI